ncbi:hypothetical protein CAPTEDRAFT_207379 [Capitella teleta]|uniref:Endonuclease/exonuclease/phosphatase domain-containing protein n=1 Tax=Capitella teleta TaxID=283909 RepID=R7UMU3_CAPTE|nr:hypothetical protein CAPTEDRAFT_207379 [Capitella teleta]|eukprot:ELU04577.1 hypothetical protein CAPTEDRAFT_207379 [Capitella teleta]
MSFKLADRSVNDGFLHVDGPHLSKCGTKRLLTNRRRKLQRKQSGFRKLRKLRSTPAAQMEQLMVTRTIKEVNWQNIGSSIRPKEHLLLHGIQRAHEATAGILTNGFSNATFSEEMEKFIADLCSYQSSDICLLGDFNVQWVEGSTTVNNFQKVAPSFSLKQHLL